MNNLSVVKSNNLIDARYRLNAQAQKLVLACISKIDSRNKTPKEISITATEFSELMGIDPKNAHRELYKAADALFKATILLRDEEEGEDIELHWVQKKAKKFRGENAVRLTWSDEVLKYISELKNRFTAYKLRNIANLQSAHAIRLYELLMRFQATKERVIYLNDFKAALGIEDKYSQFRDLNKWVIKPSIAELNKRSNLVVTCKTIKNGRSIAALVFDFNQKK